MVTALVVLDGLRPDALELARTPHLDAFIGSGSSSMSATTVYPPLTLPAHLSMLTSVPPQVHGVLDNTWNGEGRGHANLIDQIARAGRSTVAFYTWEQLRDLWTPGCMSAAWFRNSAYRSDEDHHVAAAVGDYFGHTEADFAFVYLGSIDLVGHVHGWMSDEYLGQVEEVDEVFGAVLEALGTGATVLMQSDHGGHDNAHGTDRPEDMIIPWAIAGPGINPGHRIRADVSTLDTAPTLARVLGLRQLRAWQGSVVGEAFAG